MWLYCLLPWDIHDTVRVIVLHLQNRLNSRATKINLKKEQTFNKEMSWSENVVIHLDTKNTDMIYEVNISKNIFKPECLMKSKENKCFVKI